jgi:hypothetical protein
MSYSQRNRSRVHRQLLLITGTVFLKPSTSFSVIAHNSAFNACRVILIPMPFNELQQTPSTTLRLVHVFVS